MPNDEQLNNIDIERDQLERYYELKNDVIHRCLEEFNVYIRNMNDVISCTMIMSLLYCIYIIIMIIKTKDDFIPLYVTILIPIVLYMALRDHIQSNNGIEKLLSLFENDSLLERCIYSIYRFEKIGPVTYKMIDDIYDESISIANEMGVIEFIENNNQLESIISRYIGRILSYNLVKYGVFAN